MSPILPDATIGILGGGQLGRMTATAARTLGYHLYALDPDPLCAARFSVDRCFTAGFDDVTAAAELARHCQVVTFEIEKIAPQALEAAQAHAPVRPGPHVLRIVQNRATQKRWLSANGFSVGPYREVRDEAELATALQTLGPGLFVKSNTEGYDGLGQLRLHEPDKVHDVWKGLGGQPCVAEAPVRLEAELSVLVARRPGGEMVVYPPAKNYHEHHVLMWSVLPGPFPNAIMQRSVEVAEAAARKLDVVGLLVVEMFLTHQGDLLINELAPRPHNTFHATEVACVTSQFEQFTRAICDLPLGSVDVLRPAAIVNLFSESWLHAKTPHFDAALAIPGVRVHLYGKKPSRPKRKMGHLTAVGNTPEEALARVREAASLL